MHIKTLSWSFLLHCQEDFQSYTTELHIAYALSKSSTNLEVCQKLLINAESATFNPSAAMKKIQKHSRAAVTCAKLASRFSRVKCCNVTSEEPIVATKTTEDAPTLDDEATESIARSDDILPMSAPDRQGRPNAVRRCRNIRNKLMRVVRQMKPRRSCQRDDAQIDDHELEVRPEQVDEGDSEDELPFQAFTDVLAELDLARLAEMALQVRLISSASPSTATNRDNTGQELSCVVEDEPMCGSYNLVYSLVFSDGVKWVARIPGHGYAARFNEVDAE